MGWGWLNVLLGFYCVCFQFFVTEPQDCVPNSLFDCSDDSYPVFKTDTDTGCLTGEVWSVTRKGSIRASDPRKAGAQDPEKSSVKYPSLEGWPRRNEISRARSLKCC